MATPTDLLGAFRAHLIAGGIVRLPSGGPDDGLPPMFIEPEAGPISPGHARSPVEDDATLILSIFYGGAIAAGDDAFRLRSTIDVRFRSRTSAGLQRAALVATRIRDEMFEPGDSPGIPRQGWAMAGVPLIRTGEWAPFQRVGSTDEGGYDHVWKAYVEAYA